MRGLTSCWRPTKSRRSSRCRCLTFVVFAVHALNHDEWLYYSTVQLPLPLLAPSDLSRSEPGRRTVAILGRTYEVEIARHRRARRYVLRMQPDGALRLTVPHGQSI